MANHDKKEERRGRYLMLIQEATGLDQLYPASKDKFVTLIEQEVESAEGEARIRRDRELLIMMDEAERKGWDFNRFIKTFAGLIDLKK